MRIRELAGIIFLAAMAAPAQQSGPAATPSVVIRTETKQVLVDAVVTDKKGNYVPDLPQKDFKVSEDGKEQPIRSFSYEAESALPNNAQKHYLVLFFDNSTMSFGDQSVARRAAGKFVEANAGPNRYMAVVNFTGGVRIAQNFTADAERLKQVVSGAKLSNVNPNAGTMTIGGDASTPSGSALDSGAPPSLSSGVEAEFGQRDLLLGLRAVAKGLEAVPGRKILVLFTEGFPLTTEIRSEVLAVTDTCNKANVAIYPIDVRGLLAAPPAQGPVPGFSPGPPHGALNPAPHGGVFAALGLSSGYGLVRPAAFLQRGGSSGPTGGPPAGAGGTGGTGSSPGGSRPGGGSPSPGPTRGPSGSPTRGPTNTGTGTGTRGPATITNGIVPRYPTTPQIIVPPPPPTANTNQEFMYMLADGTGGFVIANTNDLLGGLDKIGKEQNQYYLIGYTPPDTPEGSCHVLRVKVEHGGYRVRARSGYCNVKQVDLLAGKPAERDLETRAAADATGTVTSAAMQTPFFYLSPNAARLDLALEIPTKSIQFTKVKGHQHADVNILGIAYNPNGAVGARFSDTVKLDFADKQDLEAFLRKPFLHYDNQFDVAAGTYDLKVLFSSGGEEFGKLEKNPLTIDPYDGKSLFLSGIALSTDVHKVSDADTDLDAELLDGRAPLVALGMQITPGGSNRFKKADTAVCYLEVYEPLLRAGEAPGQPAAAGDEAAKPAASATSLTVEFRLLDAKTGDTKSDSGAMDISKLAKPGNPVIPVAFRLKVEDLVAGSYIAEVLAEDATHRIVARKVPFEVE
ncbi:MAG: VWA domain-containing protein [Bryobacteraceae bacterium]